MFKNTNSSYGLVTRFLHWGMSIAIITMIAVGFIMSDMVDSAQKWEIYGLHKSTGVILLVFVFFRIIWKFVNVTVQPAANLQNWQIFAIKVTHAMLYVFMFLMPASGLLMAIVGGRSVSVYNIFTINAISNNPSLAKIFWQIHCLSAYAISALIIAHIGAALYHHYVKKDNILTRMIKSS